MSSTMSLFLDMSYTRLEREGRSETKTTMSTHLFTKECRRLDESDTYLIGKVCVCVKRKYFDRRSVNEGGGFTVIGDEAMGKVDFIRGQRRMQNFDGHCVNHKMRGKQLRDMKRDDGHPNVENEQSTVLRFPLVRQQKRIEKDDINVVW